MMEARSRQRLRRSPPPQQQHGAGDPGGDDRISALSNDMLHQVLVRLRCARAAARTGLLSRRWRGLSARLPGLSFRDMTAAAIKSALARVPRRTAVSLLEIRLWADHKLDDSRAKSLLHATARLSPEEIVFVLPQFPLPKKGRAVTIVLPCFRRATSIELDTRSLRVMPPPDELPALEMLSISGNIVNVRAFLNRCPRLRVLRITFRDVDSRSFEVELAALEAAAALGLAVFRLGIEFDHDIGMRHGVDHPHFASILRAAARLSPQELLFTSYYSGRPHADLPCFHRTASLEMALHGIRFTQPPAGEFSALERLALTGCTITDLFTMIIRCPRLRVLKAAADKSAPDMKVHSVSLEEIELIVPEHMECRSIHIMTLLLKQLYLNAHGKTNLSVSISAPMMEKVSWYHRNIFCFALDFAFEMEKLLITDFSVFELQLNAKGHVIGAVLLRLLRMHHIQTNTRKLKIILPGRFKMPQTSKCSGDCPCGESKDWRSQRIFLTHLEEVEIENFSGGDDENDFVASIFGWAPMLKRLIIKLPYGIEESEIGGCATTIYNICLAHPCVNFFVYLSSGEKWSGPQA